MACLWLAYLSNTDAARWFGLAFLSSPVLATLLTFGRKLLDNRLTLVALAVITLVFALTWLL